MSELKQPPILCILSSPNDAVLKQFMAATKNCMPPTCLICPMKQAVDLASKSKPPLIKPPQPDSLSIAGDLVSTVLTNWINTQLKKPPPKQAAPKKSTSRKSGKGGAIQSVQETPRTESGDKPDNYICMITDFPKTVEQVKALAGTSTPAVCWLSLEGAAPESERQSRGSQLPQQGIDWKEVLQNDLPFFSYNFAVGNPEETFQQLLCDVLASANAYNAYREAFLDVKFVSIPKYPKEPLAIPQMVADSRPGSKILPQPTTPGKGGAAPLPPAPAVDIQSALISAYKQAVLVQLDEHLERAAAPTFSTQFQHQAELLPSYPLPASLAIVLSHVPDRRPPELFTMRSLAHRTGIPYQTIFNVMALEKFEDMVGFALGERRHVEQIPLDFVPNVLTPLLSHYSKFEWCDFAGVTLLAFYHSLPNGLPIMEKTESFELPLFHGFGRWLTEQRPFTAMVEEKPPQTEIGINVGSADVFTGFKQDASVAAVSHYFCEYGLRVDTYPATIANGVVENLSFVVNYNQSRFAFQMSQKQLPPKPEEEEEEDTVDTTMKIRGTLCRGCEFFMEHSNEKAAFVILTKRARIEFDVNHDRVIAVGAANESHRVITSGGDMIRYASHPIIYKQDGSIQQYVKGVWRLVDSEGKAYIKKNDQWFKDPANDTTSETIGTYFTNRKVTNRSDGLCVVEDGEDDATIIFPDGTKFSKKDRIWSKEGLPNIRIEESEIIVETDLFVGRYNGDHKCTLETRNEECSVTYEEEIKNVMITFGQFKNTMTMVDLVTGVVANVGARRCVYYLNDEWEWVIGHQLCSKKDIIQHFQDGDFVERLQACNEMERDEIETIVSNGQKPRLFIVEKDQNAMTVKELLAASEFQTIMEQSTTRISKKDNCNVTLWFDGEPKTYREITITTKISDEQKSSVLDGMVEQMAIEDDRDAMLNSVGDKKWRELEAAQKKEEDDILALLELYGKHKAEAEVVDNQ